MNSESLQHVFPAAETPPHANVTVWSSPAQGARAGGDWCAVAAISEHVLALTIGDVCGHGESVAGKMAEIRACVLKAMHDIRVPSEVLAIANGVAHAWGNDALVTATVAIVDHRRRTLTFANAGHPPPLMLTADQHAFLTHPPADIPLGLFPRYRAANYVVALPSDALVLFYTDGITEHNHDVIRGEIELVAASRFAYARPELNVARTVAHRVIEGARGNDDAATIGLRLLPSNPERATSSSPLFALSATYADE